MGRNDEDWAVFWCALLSALQLGEIPTRQREAYFRELSQQERLLPNGRRQRVSVRTLRREGATRRKLGIATETMRCRWSREQSNALWVGDFEHGPPVVEHGQAVKTHLSAWIDCPSRYVVGARYCMRENLDILIDSLLRAWGHHGASRELYVDNAKIYHAKALTLACTQLNIKLLHRPPRDPAAGGLIERFFQTAQGQFEAEVRATRPLTLDNLNRLLQAWLTTAYHVRMHSETAETPHQRVARGGWLGHFCAWSGQRR